MAKKKIRSAGIAYCYSHRNEFVDYSDMESADLYTPGTGKLANCRSKRLKNVYWLFYSNAVLCKAAYNAQKGKGGRGDIQNFNRHYLENQNNLYDMLVSETYTPGKYRVKKIRDPKERDIMIAPFYPDRIVHHCVIIVLGQHWQHTFIENTYACVKGRGIHKCVEDVHRALVGDPAGTRYCLKIDIRKFYDNVDHEAL